MASGHRNPRGPAQPPRIPRGFDSSDPERQGEAAPQGREKDDGGREEEIRPRRSPDSDDEGTTRRRR
ncbi:hypothetical protein HK414_02440 [Ramlibacter terrae]|uniref:Uncharacterized protein n=1 Tax=Ramlibacter terrae TaxID=2732511 RepID=A0ABX6P175_9BURK|nr:hypothetical protein HK414_02440 [Ramlibacter terrae]